MPLNDLQPSFVIPVPRCPVCADEERDVILEGDGGGVDLARCATCELVYASGRLDPELVMHERYDTAAAPADRVTRWRKRKDLEHVDRLLEGRLKRVGPGARALDIGCNNGALLDELRRLGYRTAGIELSDRLADLVEPEHTVYRGDVTLPDLSLPHRYDVITMTHVLEHLTRPTTALRFARDHLAPGGVFVVEVPNWGDIARRLWGRRYRPLELGDHVSFFEPQTLAGLLESIGLEVSIVCARPTAATLVMPSLLSAMDLALGRPRSTSQRVGGARFTTRALKRVLLGALDRLDPWLARSTGPTVSWGANLVAIAHHPRARLH